LKIDSFPSHPACVRRTIWARRNSPMRGIILSPPSWLRLRWSGSRAVTAQAGAILRWSDRSLILSTFRIACTGTRRGFLSGGRAAAVHARGSRRDIGGNKGATPGAIRIGLAAIRPLVAAGFSFRMGCRAASRTEASLIAKSWLFILGSDEQIRQAGHRATFRQLAESTCRRGYIPSGEAGSPTRRLQNSPQIQRPVCTAP
jgi:hypothetical protein